uniref:Expp1 protein n=1 Tax=Kalanchoe fedtschenkoi TaxID=63787 RepID=A0A7N0T1N0_KALFE
MAMFCAWLMVGVLVRRQRMRRPAMELLITALMGIFMLMMGRVSGVGSNNVYDPCSDTTVQKSDGFSFGLAFSSKDSFFQNQVQLSPCDSRLGLSGKAAKMAVFRPKVDEISLLTINSSSFNPADAGGYMVAFAGRKYAARSAPIMVTDGTNTITSFTLVLEFHKGVLQNLYWKKFGCEACAGASKVCIDNQDCGVPASKCRGSGGGDVDCNIGIQLTFSGTDKHEAVFNSWYEVKNLRRYSLYGLFSNIKDSITDQYNNLL